MIQFTLDGQIAGVCGWCLQPTDTNATPKYKDYLRRLASKGTKSFRCPQCEIEFVKIVHELNEEQVKYLKERWVLPK